MRQRKDASPFDLSDNSEMCIAWDETDRWGQCVGSAMASVRKKITRLARAVRCDAKERECFEEWGMKTWETVQLVREIHSCDRVILVREFLLCERESPLPLISPF